MINLTVFCRSYVEGRRFLVDHGLRGAVVHSGESAVGRRFDVIIELPSYQDCRSRFGIEALLRTQGNRVPIIRMLVDPTELAEPAPPAAAGPDELEGQVTIEEALADTHTHRVESTPEEQHQQSPPAVTPRYQPHSKSAAAKAARRQQQKKAS